MRTQAVLETSLARKGSGTRAIRTGKTAPALLLRNILRACEAVGISPEAILSGLAVSPATLAQPLGRVPWEHALDVYRRIDELTTPEQRWKIGAAHVATLPHVSAVAHLAVSPRRLIQLIVAGTWQLWPDTAVEHRDLPDGRVEISARFEPEDWPVGGMWDITTAFWACAPTLLGLPPAAVEEDISIAHGQARWVLRLPVMPATLIPLEPTEADLAADVMAIATSLATSLQSAGGVSRTECEALRIQRRLGLTLAEARVACRLAGGADLWSIARELQIARETVRTHLKRIYSKTGTRRQAELVALVVRLGRG